MPCHFIQLIHIQNIYIHIIYNIYTIKQNKLMIWFASLITRVSSTHSGTGRHAQHIGTCQYTYNVRAYIFGPVQTDIVLRDHIAEHQISNIFYWTRGWLCCDVVVMELVIRNDGRTTGSRLSFHFTPHHSVDTIILFGRETAAMDEERYVECYAWRINL